MSRRNAINYTLLRMRSAVGIATQEDLDAAMVSMRMSAGAPIPSHLGHRSGRAERDLPRGDRLEDEE